MRLTFYSFKCAFLRPNSHCFIWSRLRISLFKQLQIILSLCHFCEWPNSPYNVILSNLILKAISDGGTLLLSLWFIYKLLSPFCKWRHWSLASQSNFLRIVASRWCKWYSNVGLSGPQTHWLSILKVCSIFWLQSDCKENENHLC